MAAKVEHPYIPIDLELPGFVPIYLSQSEVLVPYLGCSLTAVVFIWIVSEFGIGKPNGLVPGRFESHSSHKRARCVFIRVRRLLQRTIHTAWIYLRYFPKLSKIERWLMCWWVFTGLTHIILEGYFAFTPDFYKKTPYLAELWKEYSKGDSRYAGRDAAVVTVEGITAVIEGPACLLAAYAIATRKAYNYTLQLAISLGQLYGCLVYFITAFLLGDNFAKNDYYYWVYYIQANFWWILTPTLIVIRSCKKINAAVSAEKKLKTG